VPQPCPAGPPSPVRARSVRRGLLLASAALALSAAHAAAAPAGGAEAGGGAEAAEPGVAQPPAAAPAPAPATPAPAGKPTQAAIRSVQRKLRLKADGIYGARTRAAVRRFQRRRGLKANGQLTAETLSALGIVGRAASVTPAAAPSAEALRLLTAIAQCESGGDPTKVSADGMHRGKYQFLVSTWESVGGAGDPAVAPEAEQDQRAAALLASEGTKPWPVCGPQAERTQ